MTAPTAARQTVRALMSLRPGYMKVEPILPPLPPNTVRILDGIPDEVPVDLIPSDLRTIGSRFDMVYRPWGDVIAVERCGGAD